MNSTGSASDGRKGAEPEDGPKGPRLLGLVGIDTQAPFASLKVPLQRAGFEVRTTTTDELGQADIYLVAVSGPADRALLSEVVQAVGECPVVAVASFSDTWDMAACLADGARGVFDLKMAPSDCVDIVSAACKGVTCMPASALSRAFSMVRSDATMPELNSSDVEVLMALASGISVAELARRTHRSSRTMSRVLRGLYDSLGVGNRRQAVEWAMNNNVVRPEMAID